MCGIAGIISNKKFDFCDLKKMTDIIRHRGPDGEGFAVFKSDGSIQLAGGEDTTAEVWAYDSLYKPTETADNVQGVFRAGFGHRRLSILDLSPCGHQPMSYLENRYWITYNGEVYNYTELRKELEESGHVFTSKTDTEVILAAYAQWGVDCLHRFNGMWAFAIYDTEKREVFMARDRFGIKPFYYWFSPDGNFAFASEIKQFTTLPGWEPKVNPQRAYDYLVYSITDHTDETMFNGVFQIPGGHYFKTGIDNLSAGSDKKIKPVKWYNLTYNKYNGSLEEAAIEFNRLFKSAVNLHLRSDVLVGSALSGGLDSSAIVCEVNNILRSQGAENLQQTFSSCSTDKRFSEKNWIDIVVNKTAVDAHYVYPRCEDIFTLTPKLTWQHDEPYQSQSAFLGYHVFELAAKNAVKVLLNGQGADEYLGGYGQFTIPRYKNMFKKLHWAGLVRDIELSRSYKPVSYSAIFKNIFYSLAPVFIKKRLANKLGYYTEIKSLICNSSLGALPLHPFDAIPVKQNSVHDVSNHLTFFSTLPKYLKWEDRNSMACSVEARVPFLDYRLVEFTYNLPDEYLDFGGETKRVLREGLKDILPEKIRNRKDKKGFITPEERWVKEDNPAIFREKIKEAIEISKGIIKPEALQYFDKVVSGKIPFDYTYWRLIQFGEWMKQFNIKS